MERRKRRLGILSYDDLLSQLADALEQPDAPARARMRQRWKIVLVDEFQDTDPVQWQVLDRAFSGHATMVLIGDPKQAIYAFRGGDVTTYLQAAESATTRKTLAVNWRSDAALLDVVPDACSPVPRSATSGSSCTTSPPTITADRLTGAPHAAPFRLRVVRRDQCRRGGQQPLRSARSAPTSPATWPSTSGPLLASGAQFEGRALEPRDVAVIAYRHADLADAREALHEVGVPAVIAGGGSVFATPAAVEWLILLEALEQPHRSPRVRAAALTCFFGYAPAELDVGGDRPDRRGRGPAPRPGPSCSRCAALRRSWRPPQPAACRRACSARVGGERLLTDLRHIGEALHERRSPRAARPGRDAGLAAATGRRGHDRPRRRADPSPRLRCGRGAAGDHPREQGTGVPRRLPAGLWRPFRRATPDMPLFHDDDGYPLRGCRARREAGSRLRRARHGRGGRASPCGCSTSP